MEISAALVKTLREKTGCGMMDCKKALAENEGDIEKAIDYLRKKGLSQADKRAGRTTSQGLIESYIHLNGSIGVMVELNCETDFVARNEKFKQLAHDLAMHAAAFSPLYLDEQSIPAEFLAKEREIYLEQARQTGKPEAVLEKIVEGKVEKRKKEICFLYQPFLKDTEITVEEHLKNHIVTIGENIVLRRFIRFQLGEEC